VIITLNPGAYPIFWVRYVHIIVNIIIIACSWDQHKFFSGFIKHSGLVPTYNSSTVTVHKCIDLRIGSLDSILLENKMNLHHLALLSKRVHWDTWIRTDLCRGWQGPPHAAPYSGCLSLQFADPGRIFIFMNLLKKRLMDMGRHNFEPFWFITILRVTIYDFSNCHCQDWMKKIMTNLTYYVFHICLMYNMIQYGIQKTQYALPYSWNM
jgi:hypothetical protein